MITRSPKVRLVGELAHTKISRARGALMNAALIQELLGIPTFTHKIRSSDGSYMEVRAQEDGAHNIEISVPTVENELPDVKVPRYAFFVEVWEPFNYVNPAKRYVVAKVSDKYRGHTNTLKAENPVDGEWKIIGYDDMDALKPRMPLPRLAHRTWSGNNGKLYCHDSYWGAGNYSAYHLPPDYCDRNYRHFSLAPDRNGFTTGMFSLHTGHTSLGGNYVQRLCRLGIAPPKVFNRIPMSEDAKTYTYYSQEAAKRGCNFVQVFHTQGIEVMICTPPTGGTIRIIALSDDLTENDIALPYILGNIASVSQDGQNIVIPVMSTNVDGSVTEIWDARDLNQPRVYDKNADLPLVSAFRQLRVRQLYIEPGDTNYKAKVAYPDLRHYRIYISDNKLKCDFVGIVGQGYWNFKADVTFSRPLTNGGDYTYISDVVASAKVSASAFRNNTIVTCDWELSAEGKSGSAKKTELLAGTSTTITAKGPPLPGYPHCATCEGGTSVAWSPGFNPTNGTWTTTITIMDDAVTASAGGHSTKLKYKFSDAWSNIEKDLYASSSTSAWGHSYYPSVIYFPWKLDMVEETYTLLGQDDPCGVPDAVGTKWFKWKIEFRIVSVVLVGMDMYASAQDRKNAVGKSLVSEVASLIGVATTNVIQVSLNQNSYKYPSIIPCGKQLYVDIDDTTSELIIESTPDSRVSREKLNVQNLKYNLCTGGETLHDPKWVSEGYYGLEAGVGIFDPAMGVVERRFSGFDSAAFESTSNRLLHLLEVKHRPDEPPVRIVRSETFERPDRWTEDSAFEGYSDSMLCGYTHHDRSTVAFTYSRIAGHYKSDPITGEKEVLTQRACIVDGDSGEVVDLYNLCGLPQEIRGSTDLNYPSHAYHVYVCEIPKALSEVDWPPPPPP